MKIAIFSDSHFNVSRMAEILKKDPADLVLHLGDYVKDAYTLSDKFPKIPVLSVKGNNDIFTNEPEERVGRFFGLTLFMVHGHQYSYGHGVSGIYRDALNVSADIALFGHTHSPYIEKRGSMLLINPGSISLPRGGSRASWALITVEESKIVRSDILEY